MFGSWYWKLLQLVGVLTDGGVGEGRWQGDGYMVGVSVEPACKQLRHAKISE